MKKLGEFELNKIYCMDALEGLKKLPESSIDLIITDPPYNLNKGFENDNLEESAFIKWLTPIFNELARVIKPKHSIIIFFDSGKKLPLFWKCLLSSKLIFQKSCTFYKPNDCSMPHNRILRTSEVFFILSKTQELYHGGDKFIHDCIIENHTKKEKWYHPTAKNLKLIRECVSSSSCKGEIILDCFMGSGTTAVACKQLSRDFIGFEINEEYVKIAKKRLSQENLLSLESFKEIKK